MDIVNLLRPPSGLRVLISAGAAGIGAGMARAFHGSGARVYVCDIDGSAIDRITGELPGIHASIADVADRRQVDEVVAHAERTLGGLDVLVNNAGVAGPTGGIEELELADWERTIEINLNGQYYFARRAVPLLKASTETSNTFEATMARHDTGLIAFSLANRAHREDGCGV